MGTLAGGTDEAAAEGIVVVPAVGGIDMAMIACDALPDELLEEADVADDVL